MRACCARVHASGRGEHVDRDDLAYPARRALVAGGDEAERPLLRVERGAVAAIGEQHRAVVHRRIEFGEREHRDIAVRGRHAHVRGEVPAAQRVAERHTGLAQQVRERDALPVRGRAVVGGVERAARRRRELRRIDAQHVRDAATDRDRGRRIRHGERPLQREIQREHALRDRHPPDHARSSFAATRAQAREAICSCGNIAKEYAG